MSLTKDGNGGGIYLNVSEGKLVRQHKQAIEGVTETRINKNGKTVFEEKFRDVSGVLKSLVIKENDFGKQWVAVIQDGDDVYNVNIPHSSRYSTSLLKALPNINLAEPLRLMPWSMTDKNDPTKKVTGITIYQGGKKIEPYYTKESPNGLPEMVQVKVKGKMLGDTPSMDEFLEKMVEEKFNPNPF